MATSGGPKIITDGLVLGFDTGYPEILGSHETNRFNKGQPTENLIGRFVNHYSNDDYWVKATNYYLVETVVQKQADPSAPGGYYTRVRGNTDPGSNSQLFWNGGNIGIGQGSGDIDEFGELVTVSAYLKGSGNVKLEAYDNNTGYKQGSNITLTDEWAYYSFSTTFGDGASNGNHWVGVREIGSGSSGIDDVYVANMQWERKTNATPYIQGIRPSTNSLIDLTRTTDIDLSNVSFDSNAQMTFDGTDDYFTTTGLSIGTPSSVSFETVIRFDGTLDSNDRKVFHWDKTSTTNGVAQIRKGNANGRLMYQHHDGSQWYTLSVDDVVTSDTYIHILVVHSSTTATMYKDGVQVGTATVGNLEYTNAGEILVGYRANSEYWKGDIPIFKVYNRALADEEVKQNYNALKSRFELP